MNAGPCFIPGLAPSKNMPLGRFLPPVYSGVASGWLEDRLPVGSWLIDPFGASPVPLVEAARQGFRVLTTVNNPIARFLLEMETNPPQESELRAVLADLGAAPKGRERIEPHLRALYKTRCAQCEQEIEARAFIWDRDAHTPSGKVYACPYCEDQGERPTTQEDVQRAEQFGVHAPTGSLHLSRALERVAPLDDPDRVYAKEALETYLPRTVYALFTLVNKLDTLTGHQRRLAEALLLAAFDQTNTLWAYPSARQRPRSLSIPPRFREMNVWMALEEAVEVWHSSEYDRSTSVELVTWPDIPPESGGICVFAGRMKELVDQLEKSSTPALDIRAVLTTFPRPNQAYWTLSALWSGWLWGHTASASFKSVLRRRRYDWAWHATALHANFRYLWKLLNEGIPFFGILPETEPGFLSAAMIAAEMAGFELSGLALRADQGEAQIHWQRSSTGYVNVSHQLDPQEIDAIIQRAALDYLSARGEPANYLYIHAAVLTSLARSKSLVERPPHSPADTISEVSQAIHNSLVGEQVFHRYGGSSRTLESGRWWFGIEQKGSDLPVEGSSLNDRVEMLVVNYLVKQSGCTLAQLEKTLCSQFCGLLTPEKEVVLACLESYAERHEPATEEWFLRPQDQPDARRNDLKNIKTLLINMGISLGYQVTPDSLPASLEEISPLEPLVWMDKEGIPAYVFYVLASAVLGKVVFPITSQRKVISPGRKWIVIPGGRAGLIRFKLERDPRLLGAIENNWEFIKYRHLRRLSESTHLNRGNIDNQLLLDPLANEDPQMSWL